ncbi:MAG: hypothetical protein ABIE22_00365 [archaeon]
MRKELSEEIDPFYIFQTREEIDEVLAKGVEIGAFCYPIPDEVNSRDEQKLFMAGAMYEERIKNTSFGKLKGIIYFLTHPNHFKETRKGYMNSYFLAGRVYRKDSKEGYEPLMIKEIVTLGKE